MEAKLDGEPTWDFVFGRSDATDELVVLYQDPRPTNRVFRLTVDGDRWEMHRADPDFHQRIVGTVDGDRMVGSADASEDAGETWRKDFDMTWERA
jgi:hypothetical protein